jgi:uncharacterized protein
MSLNISELRRGAEAGSCADQCVLGLCYLYGTEVEVNYQEALRWLSAAAEQGASRAVLNLGYMYAKGLGTTKNMPEAIRHFEAVARPADSSDAFLARMELGRLFARGEGVPVDRKAALEWYSSAIAIAPPEGFADEFQEARGFVASAG